MKSLLIVITGIVLVMLSITNYKLHNKQKEYELIKTENSILKNDVEIYYNSLFDFSFEKPLPDILLISGDTMSFSIFKKKTLIFYFPHNECKACVEQNILDMRQEIHKKDSASVFIISEKESDRFIKMLSRVYSSNNIHFGILSKSISVSKKCFFLVYPEGKVSNVFYPEKNNTGNTIVYLKHVAGFIN